NFSSDFTQNVSSKNSKITYSGHFVLTQDKAFWSYEKPAKKEIYINKNQITIVEHDLEQVIFSSLDKIPNLNEIFKLAKKIAPNELEAKYENVKYKIFLENNEVKSISYQDEFENDILITLFKQKKNTSINEAIFTPKIPKNYDLVR
ncbi:MAG: outer membrane lipoprotein chaperone LolA, partial [Campylobacter sp.]|nr:outer membrane lipoprotein chaperone LolA [Campylobacter sp.]